MKITLDIEDGLLAQARQLADETGHPLHAIVEDGLRRVFGAASHPQYELPDLRVGDPNASDPLATYSWTELRELIYGVSGAQ